MQSACQSPALVNLSQKINSAFNDVQESLSMDQKVGLDDLKTLHSKQQALFELTIKQLEQKCKTATAENRKLSQLPKRVPAFDTRGLIQELRTAMKVTPKPVTCATLFEPAVTPLPRVRNTPLHLHDALKTRRRGVVGVAGDSDQD